MSNVEADAVVSFEVNRLPANDDTAANALVAEDTIASEFVTATADAAATKANVVVLIADPLPAVACSDVTCRVCLCGCCWLRDAVGGTGKPKPALSGLVSTKAADVVLNT